MQNADLPSWDESRQWQAALHATTELLRICSFPELFSAAARELAKLLDADGSALIVTEGQDRLRYRLFDGLEHLDQTPIVKFSFPAGQGTVGHALSTGRHLFTPDYPASANSMPEFVAAGLRANLVLPLPGSDGAVGAIAIAWLHRAPVSLTPAMLAIAELFAALIGSAVYREGLERQLHNHSLTDPLTGLPNRRMLMRRLEEAQRRACCNQTLMALAVIDLDGFKDINDCLGHQAGDECLLLVANAIRGAIREIDLVTRLGGDEFVIIFENLQSVSQVARILQRVVDAIAEQGQSSPHGGTVTASLGATIYPMDFAGPEILLRHADQAMYVAKRAGGNQVCIHPLKPATPSYFSHFRKLSKIDRQVRRF